MCEGRGLKWAAAILFTLFSASALRLPQCVDSGWMKLKESELFTITCLDIIPTNPVIWSLVLLNGTTLPVGKCFSGQAQCQTENDNYVVSRPTSTTSDVRVIRNPGAFEGQTISCSDDSANTQFCNIKVINDTSRLSVSVVGPADIVTNGNMSVTLTCVVTGPVGNVRFTWSNVTCDTQAPDGTTCTFTPRPPEDDGKVVMCSADVTGSGVGSANSEKLSATYVVTLYYPPPAPPSISTSIQDPNLFMRENVTFTCKVKGGKPLVTSVTFTCGTSVPDGSDVIFSSSVMADSSLASYVTLVPADLVADCTCSALWPLRPDLYTATAVWSRTPSRSAANITTFSINGNAGNLVVYEANHTSVRFICQAKGYPNPDLLFKYYENTTLAAASTKNNELEYIISTATCEHTGVYTCAADNGIGAPDEIYRKLTVYCAPRHYPDSVPINGTEILITELRLKIIANPSPTNITFTYHGSDGSERGSAVADDSFAVTCGNDSVREYVSTCSVWNKICLENGIYHVIISNTLGSLEYPFEVLFTAPANITIFRLNDAEDTLVLNERDSRPVNITCQAKGHPLPALVLRQPGGATLSSETSSYQTSYTLPAARCEHTGNYTCAADNRVGTADEMQRLLIVHCAPRLISRNVSINFPLQMNSTGLQIALNASPTPAAVAYTYHGDGTTDEDTAMPDNAFETSCEADSGITYLVTCVIRRLLPMQNGLYRVNLSNTLGGLQVPILMENAGGAVVTYFSLNNVTSGFSINESESGLLELRCVARGNPRPNLTLSGPDGSALAFVESDTELRFNISSPKCEIIGSYICSAYNGAGVPDNVERRLTVTCAPRRFFQSAPPSEVDILSDSGLHLRLIANPVPDRFTYVYHPDATPGDVRQPPAGALSTTCARDVDVVYGITCHLTSKQDLVPGVYRVTLSNGLGSYMFSFSVKAASEKKSDTGLSDSELAGIIIGVVSFIILVIVIAVIVKRCRRG